MQTKYLLLLKPRLFWFFLAFCSGNLAAQPCDLTITIDVGECVAASSTLPVNVTIGDPYDEAKEIDILLDDVPFPWSPIDIDDIFFITFTCWVTPGEFHTIFTQSTDVPGCEETLTFYVPPCICSLNAAATVAGPCNSNQQVPVNVSVDPTNPAGTGFNLFIDGSLSPGSPYTYSASGTATVITVLVPGTGSSHSILVEDEADPGCSDVVNVTTPLCAPPPCSLSVGAAVTGPCNGALQVPVTTTVTAQNHGSGGFQLFLDGQLVTGSPFAYGAGSSTSVVIQVPGNGAAHTIQVYDAGIPGCTAQTTFTTPNCASPPTCMLNANAVVAGSCNASNQVPVNLTVTSVSPGNAGFNVFLDGALAPGSPFAYSAGSSTTVSLLVNGNGAAHVIQAQDAAIFSCSATTNIVTPNCTLPCSLTAAAAVSGSCNAGNLVPVTLTVTSSGNSSAGFNVFLDGALAPGSPFAYSAGSSTTVSLLVNGNGAAHVIQAQDAAIFSCSATTNIVTPNCTLPCSLTAAAAVSGSCNAGNQVPVTLTVTSSGSSSAGFNVFLDGALAPGSPFAYSASSSTTVSLLINGNGAAHVIQAQDAAIFSCSATTNIVTPNCTLPCSLTAAAVVSGSCNAANQVPVTLTVTSSGSSSAGFNVFLDGALAPGSPFAYSAGSSTTVSLLVNGNGALHTIQAQDAATPSCSATSNIATPNCTLPCSLAAVAAVSGSCNQYNQVPVTLTLTYSGNGNAGFNVFLDGALAPGSPFAYAAGSSTIVNLMVNGNGALHTIQAQDVSNFGCSTVATVGVPNCFTPCSLVVSATVTGNCTANNEAAVTLVVASNGAGNAGFNVFLDGNLWPGSPMMYAAGSSTAVSLFVPADGGLHLIQVQDAQTLNCSAGTTITMPNCVVPCALTATAVVSGGCNTTQNVPVTLTVQSAGSGNSGFHVFLDGSLVSGSPFMYSAGSSTVVGLTVPGNGGNHLIQVQDAVNFSCTAAAQVVTPNCQLPCLLSLNAAVTGPCNATGLVPVSLQVQASGNGNGFNLFIDGALSPGSPYNYSAGSSTTVSLFLNGDGNAHLIQVQDISNLACSDAVALVTPVCSGGPCAIGPLRTAVGIPQIIEVQVDDNFYSPSEIHAVTGDTIRFVWVGAHEHTVTSDNLSGTDVFNSGLHGTGYQFDVVITEAGDHPFYCIPHGSPGGIGMSGVIIAESPCDDGLLPVSVSFTADGGSSAGYFMTIDGSAVPGNPFAYTVSGDNNQVLNVPADGNTHIIKVTDASSPACTSVASVQMPDCNDPCFGFNANAAIQINHFDLIVDFAVAAPASGTSWNWDFGDGSTGEGPSVSHTYAAPGTYTACLIAESSTGCFDSTCYAVTLLDVRCAAKFAWTNSGLAVSFDNQSAAAGPLTNISWTFGDGGGSSETDPVHTYAAPGIYQVCLSITADTCTDVFCATLDLSDPCLVLNAGYTHQTAGDPLKLQFTDITTGNPDQWLWGFGDGQTSFSQHPLHAFAAPGVYNVCLIAGNSVTGCYAPVFCKQLGVGVNSITDPTDNPAILLFPNPLNRDLSECFISGIPAGLWGRPLDVSICDAQGRLLGNPACYGAEMAPITIPAGLTAGVYFVKIMGENTVYTSKLIVR